MTFLVYTLWFIALLALAGELDRRWGRWVCEQFLPEIDTSHIWFLPPAVSFALPGAGQFLNGEPIKGLLCFLWPFLITAMPRPWQMMALKLWWLAAPWYAIVVADALLVALRRSRERRRREAEGRGARAGAANELHAYLLRRARKEVPGPDTD